MNEAPHSRLRPQGGYPARGLIPAVSYPPPTDAAGMRRTFHGDAVRHDGFEQHRGVVP